MSTAGKKQVLLAAPRGYCAGVDRAVVTVEKALDLYGKPVYVRKQIVHNKYVVQTLEERGAIFVDETDEVPEGAIVVFSAHGVSPAVHQSAAERNLKTIDATCPLVTKVHHEAKRFAADDYDILLIGHEGHEEVDGTADGRQFLKISKEAISELTQVAMHDISHYLRSEHLAQLSDILKDPESSPNDRFVATDLLKNANISAGGILPMCQDTGTAIVMGKKGQQVLTQEKDEISISRGVYEAFTKLNLRYSQLAPVTTWEEKNTGNNLPAQIEIYSDTDHPDEYNFLFIAKGGGSANKSFLYQETKAVLNPTSFMSWLEEKLRSLGTSACPPYHLVVVIGVTKLGIK